MGRATVVAATTGAHEVGTGVGGVITTAWAVARTMVVGRDDFFDGLVPTRVVTKERSSWGFYLFERFVELS